MPVLEDSAGNKPVYNAPPATGPKPPRRPAPAPAPSGGGGGGGSPASPAQEDEKELSLEELAAQYGYAAAFFKSDKELQKLIKQAVKEQWSTAKFQAEFMATKWYRKHTAAARTWIELESRDPKEADRRVDEQTRAIRAQANQMGISLSSSRARKMAREALMMGWSSQLIRDAIVDEFEYKPGRTSGLTASLETFVKGTAADFGVQVSDGRVGGWLTKALRGDFTEDNITDLIRDMAKSRYPGLIPYFDQGLSTADVAEPYRQSYSNLLEVAVDSVSLFDPLVQKALQGTTSGEGKPGELPKVQSLFEFEKAVRKDSRWQFTRNAHKSTMDSTIGVLKDWGLYA